MSHITVSSEKLLGCIQRHRHAILEKRKELYTDSLGQYLKQTTGYLWWKRPVTESEALELYKYDPTWIHHFDTTHGDKELKILTKLEVLANNAQYVTITRDDAWVLDI